MQTRRRLGRGLEALLKPSPQDDISGTSPNHDIQFKQLSVDLIQAGQYQPRSHFDTEAINELATSIKAKGVVQPIVVREIKEIGSYEVIAGERRLRATKQAGLKEIPVLIRDVTDDEALAIALIENIQRERLNALEEASAFKQLVDEFHMTHQDISDAVGRSRTSITNLLRLLSLNSEVKEFLMKGYIEMGHARALLALSGDRQTQVAKDVVNRSLSVRSTESLLRKMVSPISDTTVSPQISPQTESFLDQLSDQFGRQVSIQQTKKGSGKLTISFTSQEDLVEMIKSYNST